MGIDDLKEFLVTAKKATYANADVEKVSSSRLGSKDYEFSCEGMTYHDTYFGGVQFIGEEVVYVGDKPIWGMNYHGTTLDSNLSEEAMDKALRPALMKVGEDNTLPVRGPKFFENDGYCYHFWTEGDLNCFNGVEEISKDGRTIYRLYCSGGMIV